MPQLALHAASFTVCSSHQLHISRGVCRQGLSVAGLLETLPPNNVFIFFIFLFFRWGEMKWVVRKKRLGAEHVLRLQKAVKVRQLDKELNTCKRVVVTINRQTRIWV